MKVNWNKYILGFACILVISLNSFSQSRQNEPLKVLFVGNSFTYFYNLPQVVAAMAESQGKEIVTRQSTVGGSNLGQHWRKERGTKTMRMLDSAKWDYVVFNNHSLSAIETPDEFEEYGKKFADLVRKKGGIPVFMMTWAYKSNPLMQKRITEAHEQLAKNTGALLVPAGKLFEQARQNRPDLEMFFDDKHPSYNATYMLALAFYKFFIDQSLEGIPGRVSTSDRNGERLYLLFVVDEDAGFLKQLVNQTTYTTIAK